MKLQQNFTKMLHLHLSADQQNAEGDQQATGQRSNNLNHLQLMKPKTN